jgi:hypothetical protein
LKLILAYTLAFETNHPLCASRTVSQLSPSE